MYKAIKDVGEYRIGDIVPNRQAEAWLEMYAVPHVEKVDESLVEKEKTEKVSEEKSEIKESYSENILEDYLGRNQSVVKKNILEDNLNKNRLKELLRLEESDKKRPLVINAIKQELNK